MIKLKRIIILVILLGIIFSTIGIYAIFDFNDIAFFNTNKKVVNEDISISIDNTKFTGENLTRSFPVNISIEIQSKSDLDVKYGCSNPFQVKLINTSLVTFFHSDFDCIRIFTIPKGNSEWFITGQFIVSQNFKLPGEIVYKIILGDNIANSNTTSLILNDS